MRCVGCGQENREGRKFCAACGVRLAPTCPACGTTNEPGENFCGECGAPLGEAGDAAHGPSAFPSPDPRSYTPKHLADKILQSKSALEGERKQVTVLFADVKGSMELAEQLGAEGWHGVLDRFFQILTDGVHRFEGTVNQYTGDGIMALFGAPIAHEDHAQRACYAGLYLQDELRVYTGEVKRNRGVDFSIRVGLNSGEVIVGKIGDDLRMDYTAQGHTVGLAQRMEALASDGSVYLSARTAELVAGYFELGDLGEHAVKGVSDPMRVFELRGVSAARTRFDLSRARGLNRVVGRDDEMALLEKTLDQALAGPGRTVGVMAQAGTGKTRLCHEFVGRCRGRGLPVYEARGLAHGKQIPLLPVRELMRDFFGIDERDSDPVAREKVTTRLTGLDESLCDELPIFFELLDVRDPTRPLPAADPEALQRRMHAAIRTIARIDGAREPGVLLIEDLHWFDPASDAVLQQIVLGNAESRGLVLVNFRPEYESRWTRQAHYQQISLLPLSEAALRELLDELLGRDPSIAALPPAIHARTRGNPFFIEEIVQSLVDDGHLAGRKGAYRMISEVEKLPLPESVQGVLAARIDRLPEREKQVLQSASVIGKTFRERVLTRMVDIRGDELGDALRALQDAEFLYEAALYPELEYTFKHPLTQEVAASSQLSERRTRAHALVARAIEELDAEHLDECAALLAHHWREAADPERAAAWHARAAEHIGTTSYQDAFHHWRQVDELLRDAQDTEQANALRTRAFPEELRLAFRVGMPADEAAALYSRGRTFLTALGDERALAVLICHYSTLLQSAGDLPEYLALIEEAMNIARRAGDPATRAALALDLLYARLCRGSLAAAIAAADEALSLVGDDVQMGADLVGYSALIMNLAFSAFALAQAGQFAEAERRLRRAARVAHAEVAPETRSWLSFPRIELAVLSGEGEEAVRAGEWGLEQAERSGSRFDAVAGRCWLGQARVAAGHWRDAAAVLEEAAALAREQSIALDIVCGASWALPTAYLGLGDLGRARAEADAAVELCRAQRARVSLCRAHLARAAIALADPPTRSGQAEGDLDAAEELVAETGARAFQPQIHEGRAALAAGTVRERHLREAHRLYEEMGATGHAARLAQELAG